MTASARDEQIERFQLYVDVAIDCEKMALNPGSLPRSELARCGANALDKAIHLFENELAGVEGSRGRAQTLHDLRMARTIDQEVRYGRLTGQKVDAQLQHAIAAKRAVVKIIYLHAPRPRGGACKTEVGFYRDLLDFYEFYVECLVAIHSGVLFLPQGKISGKAGYATPKGEHGCRHDAHSIDCEGIPAGTTRVTFFAQLTPPPKRGQIGILGIILGGRKIGFFHRIAQELGAPLQPGPKPPPGTGFTLPGSPRNATGSFTNGQGCPGLPTAFTDNFIFSTPSPGTLTIEQPSTGDVDTGPINRDGTFHVSRADGKESYEGRIVGDTATATNHYTSGGCTETYEVRFTLR